MARYGKTIKMVENLVEKAYNSPTNTAVINKSGQEVYKVEIEAGEGDTRLKLYHYETETLVVNTTKEVIEDYYGYSASDRDSMNTVLDSIMHRGNEFFKLSQGEIILA